MVRMTTAAHWHLYKRLDVTQVAFCLFWVGVPRHWCVARMLKAIHAVAQERDGVVRLNQLLLNKEEPRF